MKNTLKLFSVCVFALFTLSAYAAPSEAMQGDNSAVKSACSTEAGKFCSGMDIGTGLLKCLHEHHKDLSKDCRKAMHARHKEAKAEKAEKAAAGGGTTAAPATAATPAAH